MSPTRRFLIDTNIISYVEKEDSRAAMYRTYLDDAELSISFQTYGELLLWAQVHRWSAARIGRFEQRLRNFTIIPATEPVVRGWVRIQLQARKRPISPQDAWIAACALAYDLPLVTHNPRDFHSISELEIVSASDSS